MPGPVAIVLSIGKLSLGQEAYYLEEVLDGAEDYYLSVGEAPGRWVGTGASRLGLEGMVEADDLRAVLAGRRPGTDDPLRVTRASLPGLDLTLSAPKSVSLVWGLGDEATAEAVVACHDRAVDSALEYLERHACHVRRGHGGATVCDADGLSAPPSATGRAGPATRHFTPTSFWRTWPRGPTGGGPPSTPATSTVTPAPLEGGLPGDGRVACRPGGRRAGARRRHLVADDRSPPGPSRPGDGASRPTQRPRPR